MHLRQDFGASFSNLLKRARWRAHMSNALLLGSRGQSRLVPATRGIIWLFIGYVIVVTKGSKAMSCLISLRYSELVIVGRDHLAGASEVYEPVHAPKSRDMS